jgi:hypothetical protein
MRFLLERGNFGDRQDDSAASQAAHIVKKRRHMPD